MKISSVASRQNAPVGFRARALRFRDFLKALQSLPGILSKERRPDGHFSAMGPLTLSGDSARVAEGGTLGAVKPVEVEGGVEELAHKIGQAAQRAVGSERVVVSFNSGWFSGVSCVVSVRGQAVRCRFKSSGALGRKLLGEARRTVARRLEASGFELEGFEVGS